MKNTRLHKVDGVEIKNLAHLVRLLEENRDQQFVQFEFDHQVRIILDRQAANQQTALILAQHGIASPYSSDLEEQVVTGSAL